MGLRWQLAEKIRELHIECSSLISLLCDYYILHNNYFCHQLL